MSQRQQLSNLLKYDLWCTHSLLDQINRHSPFSDEVACLAFLSHIINMQGIWYDRVLEDSLSETEKWDEYKPKQLGRKARKLNQKWLNLIDNDGLNLQSEIGYFTERRVKKSARIDEICRHIIVHGEYHRAQISLFLRNCDIKPLKLDYSEYSSGH